MVGEKDGTSNPTNKYGTASGQLIEPYSKYTAKSEEVTTQPESARRQGGSLFKGLCVWK